MIQCVSAEFICFMCFCRTHLVYDSKWIFQSGSIYLFNPYSSSSWSQLLLIVLPVRRIQKKSHRLRNMYNVLWWLIVISIVHLAIWWRGWGGGRQC